MSYIELYDEMYNEVVPHGWLRLPGAYQLAQEEVNKPAQKINLNFKKDIHT